MALLTIAEAARRLPFSDPALRAQIKKGVLTPTWINGRMYLDEAELRTRFSILFKESGQ